MEESKSVKDDWLRDEQQHGEQGGNGPLAMGASQELATNELLLKLRESERRFRDIFDHAAIGIAYVTIEGRWLEVNQKICEITGFNREELLERTFQELTCADDLEMNLSHTRRLLAREIETYTVEKRYVRKDGSLVWVQVTVSLVRDDAAPPYLIAFIEDIDQRKRAEEERLLLLQHTEAARKEAVAAAEKLTMLQTITDTALAHLSLENLLTELLNRIGTLLNADAVAILLPTIDGRHLKVRASRGLDQEIIQAIEVPLDPSVMSHIALRQGPIIVNDLSRVRLLSTLLQDKIRSLLGAPLLVEGQVIGFLSLGTMRTSEFTQEDAQLLQRVADRAALAIDRVRLYEADLRTRKEAMERAQQLEAIIDAMSDLLFVYDSNRQLLYTSKSAQAILPLEQQPDFFSRSFVERIPIFQIRDEHGQPLPREQWPIERMLKGEALNGDKAVDVILRVSDGRDLHYSMSGSPMRDASGQIIGCVIIAHEVTQRRRLERQTQQALEGLLAMAEALVQLPEAGEELQVIGHRMAVLTCNVLGCQRVGMYIVEAVTEAMQPIAVVGLSEEQEQSWWAEQQQNSLSNNPHPELVASLRAGEILVLDMTQPPFNAQPNPYDISVMLVAPMCIGDRLVGLITLDYGGEKHKYTQKDLGLASAIAKLAALVVERQRLLSERVEAQGREVALREANRRMEEFLGIASHELRTPLTTIKANIQLAQRRLKGITQPGDEISLAVSEKASAAQDMLVRAERQVGVLNRLVGDLIDISRIQTGKLQLHLRHEPCDLAQIVQEAVQEQRKATPSRIIELSLPPRQPVAVIADPDRIAQVLTNYLSNALKYSLADRPVRVRLEVEDELVRVSVHDEGPGLSPQDQERIWQCFYQSDEIKVLSGSGVGLGLGLYISQTIVTRHQGQVGVESIKGEGSTFWFTLPLAHVTPTGEDINEAS